MSLAAEVSVFLAATVVAVPLFRRLKLGAVLGFLVAGLCLGPAGLGVVKDVGRTLAFAEFGVVLLLFVIGLELQPSRLWVLRRTVFGLGTFQMLACTAVLGGAAFLLGQAPAPAFIIGFALSLSSTALVLQVLAERKQLQAPHGRASFGILLFQDLAVMPVLVVLPLLGGGAAAAINPVHLAIGAGVLALVVVGGRPVLRHGLRWVAATGAQEAFTAAALLVVLGMALLFEHLGLSMGLGAFIAGVLLADSEHRHELEADIEPFKGLLLGLFFIAVGMSANLGLLLANPGLVLAVAAGFVVLKAATLWAMARIVKHGHLSARSLAAALCGGGEFAFVLLALAARERVLPAQVADLVVLAVTLSMLAAPLIMLLQARFDTGGAPAAKPFDEVHHDEPRVIIAGYGRVGQVVSRVLRARGIRFTALELSQAQVDFVRRFGNKLYYGDASRLELLRAAGAAEAQVLVVAVDDPEAAVRTAQMARRHFPALKVVARARNRQQAFRLFDLGITEVHRETLGSSLDMAEDVLVHLGFAVGEARHSVKLFRDNDAALLREQHAMKDDEEKLMATAKAAAAQLERIFEADPTVSAAPRAGEAGQGDAKASP